MFRVINYGVIGDGVADDAPAFQRAIDAATAMPDQERGQHVTVHAPAGKYNLASQVVVKPYVNLLCEGVFYNGLVSTTTPAIIFQANTRCERLVLWGNGKAGVAFGTQFTAANIDIQKVRLFNIGELAGMVGIGLYGYNFRFDHLEVDGGETGLEIRGASDILGSTYFSYTAKTGLKIHSGCEHIKINAVTIDTPDYLGLQIDSSHDISLNTTIYENDQVISGGTGTITRAIRIGQYSSADKVSLLDLTAKVCNTGGKGMDLYNCRSSKFDLIVSNTQLGTGNAHPNTTGIEYFSGVESDVATRLNCSLNVTPTLGTVAGSLEIIRGQ